MKEQWKPITVDGEIYENYSVSSEGNIRNDKTGRILKKRKNKNGYEQVNLYKNGKGKGFRIHRLVAEAFIPNPDNKPCIDHINCVRDDNRVDNLRWCTQKENNNNPLTRKNLSEAMKGENHPMYGKQRPEFSEAMKGENNPMYGRTGELNPNSKAVICITTGDVYGSTYEAERKTQINHSSISSCCKGNLKSAGAIEGKPTIWMYLDDYNKLTKEEIEEIKNKEVDRSGRKEQVICITTGKIYESTHEAERQTGVAQSSISKCCNGVKWHKSAGKSETGEPLVWMYYDDYLKQIKK